MKPSNFINTIVKDILKKEISSNNMFKYDGSRNTLRQCVNRNTVIGDRVVTMLSNMISMEIDIIKKDKAIDYVRKIAGINSADIKELVTIAADRINRKDTIMNTDNFKIVGIPELLKMGWTIRQYVEAATLLSYEEITGLTDEHNGEIEDNIKIVSEQPENRRILLDENNNMIGMWSFKPFYDDIFQKAKNGELYDGEIRASMLPTLIPGIYNIYFSNICLKKHHRKSKVFKILWESIIELFQEWAKDGIYIKEICAQAYTTSGINLCKTAGLQFHKNHIDHGEIYCGYVWDLVENKYCNEFEEVRKLYQEFKHKNK